MSKSNLPERIGKHDSLPRDFFADIYTKIDTDIERVSADIQRWIHYIKDRLFSPALTPSQIRRGLKIRDNAEALRFHSEVGEAPGQYIIKMRMLGAMKLLRYTNFTITRIAEIVAYTNLQYFSAAFAHYSGCRPKMYRVLLQELPEELHHLLEEPEVILEGSAEEKYVAEILRLILQRCWDGELPELGKNT